MPFTIDEAAARKQLSYDVSKQQELAPKEIPETWMGTASRGLPVREIPHFEFPLCVYMHPLRPTITVLHRNERHEVVDEERIPTEHLSRLVGCAAHVKTGGPAGCVDCQKGLEAALAEGWVREPYIPKAPEKADADLYGRPGNK